MITKYISEFINIISIAYKGNIIFVKLVQPENTCSPIVSTVFGITILSKLLKSENVLLLIFFTVLGITNLV